GCCLTSGFGLGRGFSMRTPSASSGTTASFALTTGCGGGAGSPISAPRPTSGPGSTRGRDGWTMNSAASSARWAAIEPITVPRISATSPGGRGRAGRDGLRAGRGRLRDEAQLGDAGAAQARDQLDDVAVRHALVGLQVHGPVLRPRALQG